VSRDSAKASPWACGCDVADLDSDGDNPMDVTTAVRESCHKGFRPIRDVELARREGPKAAKERRPELHPHLLWSLGVGPTTTATSSSLDQAHGSPVHLTANIHFRDREIGCDTRKMICVRYADQSQEETAAWGQAPFRAKVICAGIS